MLFRDGGRLVSLDLGNYANGHLNPFRQRAKGPPQAVQADVRQLRCFQRLDVSCTRLGNLAVLGRRAWEYPKGWLPNFATSF